MPKIYKSVSELIGNTPILELSNIKKHFNIGANLFAKLECFNPAGSSKDRVALSIINDAEKKGIINKDTVIIEPTSGNTGIGLSAVAASKGYKTVIVMPDTMSMERRLLMKAYGAKLVLSDGSLGMTGAIKKAEELNKENPNSIIAGQFTNPSNPQAHFDTTGPEIYSDMEGKIIVEIVEYTELNKSRWGIKKEEIKGYDMKLSLDDYSTGNNDITAVDFFNPHYVKLDRSLISGIDKDESKQQKVIELIEKFHNRNIEIVAEGVETKEEYDYLRDNTDVDYLQGYYLAMPQ